MKTILLLIVVKQDYELTPINRHAGIENQIPLFVLIAFTLF
jgi:hypothetical protein